MATTEYVVKVDGQPVHSVEDPTLAMMLRAQEYQASKTRGVDAKVTVTKREVGDTKDDKSVKETEVL